MSPAEPTPSPQIPPQVTPKVPQQAAHRLWSLWLLVALTCLPEIVFLMADYGIWGSTRWRSLAYQNGAFWPGLLRNWSPNYSAQPVTMFISYAGLHAGPAHLIGNMVALVWLGQILHPVLGVWRFMTLYVGTAIGGAALFGLMSTSPAPMVGASGALFGLAGAWMVQEWRQDLRPMADGGRGARATWIWLGQIFAILLAVNLMSWFLQDGHLAWETHLGGWLLGVIMALGLGIRPAKQPASHDQATLP